MHSQRQAQTDGLSAKRLTPQNGYASFRAAFVPPGNEDTIVSPYFRKKWMSPVDMRMELAKLRGE